MALIQPDVGFALASGEQLESRGMAEPGLDVLQQLRADSLTLVLGMDDEATDAARAGRQPGAN
jgi:hypothetical protein